VLGYFLWRRSPQQKGKIIDIIYIIDGDRYHFGTEM
jgi:hypothetical protein